MSNSSILRVFRKHLQRQALMSMEDKSECRLPTREPQDKVVIEEVSAVVVTEVDTAAAEVVMAVAEEAVTVEATVVTVEVTVVAVTVAEVDLEVAVEAAEVQGGNNIFFSGGVNLDDNDKAAKKGAIVDF